MAQARPTGPGGGSSEANPAARRALAALLRRFPVAAACAGLMSLGATADAYPTNLLSARLGASVSTEARLSGATQPEDLLSEGPVSNGRIAFAGIRQRRDFTIGLGGLRPFDRAELSVGGARPTLTISVSREGPGGVFTNVLTREGLGAFQVLRLPETSARWVRLSA